MSVPVVTPNELDGALGVLPAGLKPIVIVGAADAGPLDTPASFARTKDVVANFVGGPLVEAAAYVIKNTGRPVVLVRTGNSVAATNETIDVTGVTGTSVVTDSGTVANDDYELYFKVIAGGTVGTEGITYQESTDGGRTLSAVKALGTANSVVIGGTGAGFDFAAGTLTAGAVVEMRCNAPQWNATELGTALQAAKASAIDWALVLIVGDIDATDFDTIGTEFSSGNYTWVGSVRDPDPGETEAAYLSSLTTAFASKANNFGVVCAGAAKITSGLSFEQHRKPIATVVASLLSKVSEEIDIAAIDLGSLPGVAIRDVNGNADEHDEDINPGLDDARFTVLRTHKGYGGVYVNNPRIFSASGSDFEFAQHRRTINLAKVALTTYFKRRLSKPILVDKDTGYILESEALEIESGATAIMRAVLTAKPKASAVSFALSRLDNLLSTKTLNGQAGVTPLAYPKQISFDIGFTNPALALSAV